VFLIFGFRSRSKVLTRLLLVCGTCQKPAAQTLILRVRWFTLFFIPVIPFARKHLMQCALCGSVSKITKEEAARLSAMPQETAPAQAGSPQAPRAQTVLPGSTMDARLGANSRDGDHR